MVTILSILICFLEAKKEVKYGDKHDLNSKIQLTIIILLFTFIPMLIGFYYGTVIYLVVRFSMFDYMYSYLRFKTLFYLGKTSDHDKIMKRVLKKIPNNVLLIIRFLLFICIIVLEIKTLKV